VLFLSRGPRSISLEQACGQYWRITLEPAGAGTRIVQTFAVTKCPRWWEWIVARSVPGHDDRSAALTDDLRRIAAVAAATNDPSLASM
jgi:hypothetical protein